MVSILLVIGELMVLPALLALLATFLTVRQSTARWVTHGVPIEVESDLRNESMSIGMVQLYPALFFGIYFNLIFLSVNFAIAGKDLFGSPYIFSATLACYLLSLYFALSFVFRFTEWRHRVIGLVFAILGSLVLAAALEFGFGSWTLVTGGAPGGWGNLLVPLIFAGTAYVLAGVSFLRDLAMLGEHLPFRFEGRSAYRTLLLCMGMGYLGTMFAIVHPLSLLV